MIEIIVSVAAIVIALISLFFAVRSSRAALSTSVAPVIVFSHDPEIGWIAENVGNGPALNVVLYDGDTKELGRAVQAYAIAKGARVELPWAKAPGQLAASWQDVHGDQYCSHCQNDLTSVSKGRRLIRWSGAVHECERILRHKNSASSP